MARMDSTNLLSVSLLLITALSVVGGLRCYNCLPGHPCCLQTCDPGYGACGTLGLSNVLGASTQTRQCAIRSSCGLRVPITMLGHTVQAKQECCYTDDCNAPGNHPQPAPVCETDLQCYSCLPNKACHLVACPILYDTCFTMKANAFPVTIHQCGKRNPICGRDMTVKGISMHLECCDGNGCNLERKTGHALDTDTENAIHSAPHLVHPTHHLLYPAHHVSYNITKSGAGVSGASSGIVALLTAIIALMVV